MHNFRKNLEEYALTLTEKFSLPISFNPEDQLKTPVTQLLSDIGDLFFSNDFPKPTDAERKGPDGVLSETPLLDFAEKNNRENND